MRVLAVIAAASLIGCALKPALAEDWPTHPLIVGAGSAGCVLANRLSEDETCKVLIEAGGMGQRPVHPYSARLGQNGAAASA